MLPLASPGQLSTSGLGKSVPIVLCTLIWSFAKQRNTAKIIKAAVSTIWYDSIMLLSYQPGDFDINEVRVFRHHYFCHFKQENKVGLAEFEKKSRRYSTTASSTRHPAHRANAPPTPSASSNRNAILILSFLALY